MALGSTNITTAIVRNYISGTSNKVSELVGKSGLNKFSFYAPGQLDVDTNKDIVLTPPSANYKLGDYRLYDASAVQPEAADDFTLGWGPGGSSFNAVIPWHPNTLNIKEFAATGDYVTFNFYASASDRTAEGNRVHTFTAAIQFSTITPLLRHTRTTSYKVNPVQIPTVQNIPTAYSTLYLDTFISDISGNRLINLGTKANGYTTLTLVESLNPRVTGQYSGMPVTPSGYTTVFPNVYASTRCTTGGLDQSIGTSYSFSVVCLGIHFGGNRTIRLSSVDVILTLDGIRTVLQSGSELPSAGKAFIGTLATGAWNLNDIGYVTFENAIIDISDELTC